jgi:two-component system, NarL family, nitrate/nitrite response regulator NarL
MSQQSDPKMSPGPPVSGDARAMMMFEANKKSLAVSYDGQTIESDKGKERRPYGIVLIGPHALLREGLIHILSDAQFRVVASAPSLSDLAPNAFQQNDRIVLIIESNNDLNIALPQIRSFKENHPTGRVAVLGSRNRPADMVAAFQAGANVYFDSEERCDAFIKALELVMLGETILPQELLFYVRYPQGEEVSPKVDRHLPEPASKMPQLAELDWPQLSFRENCILRCIVEGASNKVIARRIDITEATVKIHVKAILRKVRVRNRTQAAVWATKHAGSVWHDGYNRAKGPAPLPVASPNSPVQTLAGRKTESGAKGGAIADVSRFISPGLNGNSS